MAQEQTLAQDIQVRMPARAGLHHGAAGGNIVVYQRQQHLVAVALQFDAPPAAAPGECQPVRRVDFGQRAVQGVLGIVAVVRCPGGSVKVSLRQTSANVSPTRAGMSSTPASH